MNKLSQQELWEKIQNFNFDDQNSSYPFSKKLANENHWSFSFTQQAIAEYRKFIFLCCISPTGASPSETVDKVWHLHLTYTKNYWEDFCSKTLQQDIHHHPSKGGPLEKTKHDNWYQQTLIMYEAVFKLPPPADIWPSPAENEPAFTTAHIYDMPFFRKMVIGFLLLVLSFIVLVPLYNTTGPVFLLYYAVLAAIGVAVIWFTQLNKSARLRRLVAESMPARYNNYQICRFVNGPHRMYQTALVDLLKRNIIEAYNTGYVVTNMPVLINENEQNPLLLPLSQGFSVGDCFSYLEGYALVENDSGIKAPFEKLYHLSQVVDNLKLLLPAIVVGVGLARMFQGLANEKPIEFLLMIMMFFAFITAVLLQNYSYTHTVKSQVKKYWEEQHQNGYTEDVVTNFSLLGTVAIAGFAEYSFLTANFQFNEPQDKRWTGSEYSSSSSCGSGDGGGGCGGGCGGCGS